MGAACNTQAGRSVYRFWVGKPERKKLLGKPTRRWEDISKMDLQVMDWVLGLD